MVAAVAATMLPMVDLAVALLVATTWRAEATAALTLILVAAMASTRTAGASRGRVLVAVVTIITTRTPLVVAATIGATTTTIVAPFKGMKGMKINVKYAQKKQTILQKTVIGVTPMIKTPKKRKLHQHPT